MPNYPTNHHLYTLLWNKYRPAIVKLMADAQEAPQEYTFQPHEFKDVNPKEKGGYWFTMEVYKGKAQNNIKGSVVAQDLLLILQKSGRALELFETSKYEFTLDKQFTFCVSQEPVVEETEEENAEASDTQEETTEAVATEEASSEEAESSEEAKEETKEEEVKEEAEAEKKEA
ncbi:MAG: hypothetical protein ABJP45_03140 [Cyclobacteriaceae bacterium]